MVRHESVTNETTSSVTLVRRALLLLRYHAVFDDLLGLFNINMTLIYGESHRVLTGFKRR